MVTIEGGTGMQYFDEASFTIYPSPVRDNLYLSMTCQSVKVYDTAGMLRIQKENVSVIDMTTLEDGLYLVDIAIGNKTISKKITLKK